VHSESGTQTRKKRIQGGLSGGSGWAASDGDHPGSAALFAAMPATVGLTTMRGGSTSPVQQSRPNTLSDDMTRQQFEGGVQRLYYVAWACFSTFYLGAGLVEMDVLPSSANDIGLAIGVGLLIVILPAVLMHVVRWIYRGFVPR
jgi:hypothetical protein